RDKKSKILYIAFNKSVKQEAIKKFKNSGLQNVTVETAHSLAYRHIVSGHNYSVRNSYKAHEVATILGIKNSGEKHIEFIAANHINKFTSYFCNADKEKVFEVNYLDVVRDVEAQSFVKANYYVLSDYVRRFLDKMNKGEIDVTHDFYLKKFQLSNPKLGFDYILFDEGQDASPVMLDVFLKQNATKVIVGDTHQQIYGFRYAVNSLEKVNYPTFNLSTSFRFDNSIATLAIKILDWKKHLTEQESVKIVGNGGNQKTETKAVLARTNLGLLLKAIEIVAEKKEADRIYFEGNISSYTYAEDGASLYDVLNLYNGNYERIKDPVIKTMQSIEDLESYIEKTEDLQLKMILDIVITYDNEIYDLIKAIKDKHVEEGEKEKAQLIFSTVHKCKGMEYDSIQLANDFITEEDLKKYNKEGISQEKLNEEINLLYVAITRTKNILKIPEILLPERFQKTTNITITDQIIKGTDKKTNNEFDYYAPAKRNRNWSRPDIIDDLWDKEIEKFGSTASKKKISLKGNEYSSWTSTQDYKLSIMYLDKKSIEEMSQEFGRTKGAIRSRIKKLGLKDMRG